MTCVKVISNTLRRLLEKLLNNIHNQKKNLFNSLKLPLIKEWRSVATYKWKWIENLKNCGNCKSCKRKKLLYQIDRKKELRKTTSVLQNPPTLSAETRQFLKNFWNEKLAFIDVTENLPAEKRLFKNPNLPHHPFKLGYAICRPIIKIKLPIAVLKAWKSAACEILSSKSFTNLEHFSMIDKKFFCMYSLRPTASHFKIHIKWMVLKMVVKKCEKSF